MISKLLLAAALILFNAKIAIASNITCEYESDTELFCENTETSAYFTVYSDDVLYLPTRVEIRTASMYQQIWFNDLATVTDIRMSACQPDLDTFYMCEPTLAYFDAWIDDYDLKWGYMKKFEYTALYPYAMIGYTPQEDSYGL